MHSAEIFASDATRAAVFGASILIAVSYEVALTFVSGEVA